MNNDEKTPNEKPITSLSAEEQKRFREFLEKEKEEKEQKEKEEKLKREIVLG